MYISMEKIKTDVMRYLGRRGQEVPDDLNCMAEECITLMRKTASFRQAHSSFSVRRDNGGLSLAGVRLKGKDIARYLSGCGGAVLLAATLGAEADALILRWKRADLTRSFVLDACATQLIEEYCDEIQRQICAEAADTGLVATGRFSPGYGDLPLDIQPGILEALNADRRIGLTCTEHFILLPRKSVTALIGLGEKPAPRSRGCGDCALRDSCNFYTARDHPI